MIDLNNLFKTLSPNSVMFSGIGGLGFHYMNVWGHNSAQNSLSWGYVKRKRALLTSGWKVGGQAPSGDGYWRTEVQEEPGSLKSEDVCSRHKEDAREWTE